MAINTAKLLTLDNAAKTAAEKYNANGYNIGNQMSGGEVYGPTQPKRSVSSAAAAAAQTANGITASGSNAMTQGSPSQQTVNTDGLFGVRDTLVSRGADNNKIGWNDTTKSVTYNGKDVYKPTAVVNGKSYASEQDINSVTNKTYSAMGDELVQATAKATGTGLDNIVQWSDGKCYVGGKEVAVKYVDADGKAMVSRSELEAALDDYKNQNGIIGDKDVYDKWNNKYNGKLQSALNKIIDREGWEYNPYNDPAYQAYRNQYEREGNRAYQDAYASMSGGTGGFGNSAAVTAAGQQLNYYQQQLNDRVPELQAQSWERYLGEQELNRAALDAIRAVGNDDYSKLYTANSDAYNRVNQALEANYARDMYNRGQGVLTDEEIKRSKIDTDYYPAEKAAALESAQTANKMNALQNLLTTYSYSGNLDAPISAADAARAGISPRSDGTYPTIREIQTVYSDLQDMLNLNSWNNYGKREYNDQLWEDAAVQLYIKQQLASLGLS